MMPFYPHIGHFLAASIVYQAAMEALQSKLTELHNLSNDIDVKTERKNVLKDEVLALIKENKWEDKKFSIGNRNIRCKKEVTKGGLTQKYLACCLKEYFAAAPQEADKLYDYILEHRPHTEKESLEIVKKAQ